MDISVDEAEHGMEMHLPYIAKVFERQQIKIVPILIGAHSAENQAMYGQILSKYLDDPNNLLCHRIFVTGDIGS